MAVTLRLAAVFSDHMVLCRDRDIRIFGEAQSGRTVTVTLLDHTVSCTAVKNKFETALPPIPHGGPYMMTVSDGENKLQFFDILIGDVYLAGGQSNMEMMLKDTQDGKRYTDEADYPQIRYCNCPVQAWLDEKTLAEERKTKWRAVQPGTCSNISAAAYHFAVKLQAELNIPVGIIGCYLGGTSIVTWLDENALCTTTGGKEYLEAFQSRIEGQTDAEYEQAYQTQQRNNAKWSRGVEKMLAHNPAATWDDFIAELGPCPWPPPEGRKSAYRPCGLANTMLKRIAPYSITGFLYYQGESDHRHPQLYRALLMSLITFWRDLFRSPSLPFLNVQLPMYLEQNEDTLNSWASIRRAQEQVYQDMRNTGLAVMIDSGEKTDIHPKDKKIVGERLFEEAMHVVYGRNTACSPRATATRCDGSDMHITVSAPLRNEKAPRLFELAGEDGVFYQAEAVICGTDICVRSKQVATPRAVRYAWVNYDHVNVFGENGLPLAPFMLP